MKKNILFLLVLFAALQIASTAGAVITVGRISHVEGEIFRYMDVDNSWGATFLQSPVGTRDVLLTGDNSRAEIAFPNNQLLRLEENTEIEIQALEEDSSEFTLHSGLARFYNRKSAGEMIVETVRGTVKVEPGGSADVLVEEDLTTVSAVYGEAAFHTFQDGVERMEVISGSTMLEFQKESIVAGTGPLDRKWDRWCAEREGALAQNGLVRSEHLPESMQEYAYAMEPYGHWQKIYYGGYYYWAWKPQSVSADWSPYTTGYWYDWHGSEVWVDYNPWGWVTHHHGHWLNLHGAWLWTPYVHVSHVSGVTVIGLNITFGKRYRSHWHPGRVRWITHNDYIGWLPLAPSETYYGYRKWGPRTAVVQEGTIFNVNINLSNHRHIDHAVVIPKRYLHHRDSGARNNYKGVRVNNINKMTILKNYKPLHTLQRSRAGKNSAKVTRAGATVKRIESNPVRRTAKTRKLMRTEKYPVKRDRTLLARPNIQKERIVAGKYEKDRNRKLEKKSSSTLKKTENKVQDRKTRGRVVRTEKRPFERTVTKSSRRSATKSVALSGNARKNFVEKGRSKERNERIGQAKTETVRKPVVKQERKTVAVQNKRVDERKRSKIPPRRKMPGRVVRTEKSPPERTVEKSSINISKKRETVRDNERKSFVKNVRTKERSARTEQAKTETVRKPAVRGERKTVAVRSKSLDERRQSKSRPRVSRVQGERKQNSAPKAPERNRNYIAEESEENTIQKQAVRGSRNNRERIVSRENAQYEKRSGRGR